MYEEPKMEKITINLPPVDLGKIDILIESGAYPSRTEFIRSAIRKSIEANNDFIEKRIEQSKVLFEEDIDFDKEEFLQVFGIGVFSISKKYIEKSLTTGKKIRVHIVGVLVITNDITPDMVKKTFDKVKVFGVIRAPSKVKDAIKKIVR